MMSKMDFAYFDNAATTFPKPNIVYAYMDSYYKEFGFNIGRSQFSKVDEAQNMVEETRNLINTIFHSPNHKVVFTSSATEAINIVLQGYTWKPNMKVYITPFEHNAVTRTLHYLKEIYQLQIIQLSVDSYELTYDVENILYQFQEDKPDVVIMSHASNVCGLVAPVEEIFSLAKKYKAFTVLDMAQTAGLIDINIIKSHVDCAIFAGHKTLYGPFGVGGFTCDSHILLKPLIYGGTGIDSANQNMPNDLPMKFEAGSKNIYAIAGLNAAIKWILEIGINKIFQQEQKNLNQLINLISEFSNIKMIGHNKTNKYVGIISCIFEGFSSNEIGNIFVSNNIIVRKGLQCSPLAHKFLYTFPNGTIRFSVSYFSNENLFVKLEKVFKYIEDGT